eukprot:8799_1
MANEITGGGQSLADQLPSTDNPVLDELLHIMVSRFEVLVERGFLAPHFLNKMVESPNEVLKFIRQNRAVVADTLNKRLNRTQRPTREDLERRGIVPRGYFNYGHEMAMKTKHRRKSSTTQDLEMQLKLRPHKEDIIRKGVVSKHEMEQGGYYELDDTKLVDLMEEEDNEYYDDHNEMLQVDEGQISILSSLLFKTISSALAKSCVDTQHEEGAVLQEMVAMNAEMAALRDVLDKYLLSSDIGQIQQSDEHMVRDKFHSIQTKLVHISSKQNSIHEKLRILHSVERSMVSLQNKYQMRLSALKKTETQVLSELREQKQRRDRALKIMYAEKSHKSWAMTKLDYTINIAKESDDVQFVSELSKFVNSLKNISEHQKQIVRDFETTIDDLETNLIRLRYDMSKVRTMTFKKIYDLHKQVQLADTLELGYDTRRLSVASATEVEREKRHHNIKIRRQLTTLEAEIKSFDYALYERNLKQCIDVEYIMSNAKLKSFFAVFIQTVAQTVIDIELTWNNLNSELPPIDGHVTVTALCNSLYGVHNVLDTMESVLDLNEKLSKCVTFIDTIKRAIDANRKVKTFEVNDVILIVARKLCIQCVDDIDQIDLEQVPKYAQDKSIQLFQTVLNGRNKMFKIDPISEMDAAEQILQQIYGVKMKKIVI